MPGSNLIAAICPVVRKVVAYILSQDEERVLVFQHWKLHQRYFLQLTYCGDYSEPGFITNSPAVWRHQLRSDSSGYLSQRRKKH